MKRMAFLGMLLVAGCATSVMQGLVGKDLNQVVAKYGPPANTLEAGERGTAYQWQLGKTLSGSECYYTLYGKPDPSGKVVIHSYEEPRAMCE